MLQYSSTHNISFFLSTVPSQQCTFQFNTHWVMLRYTSTHTVSCYSTVQHTLYHVTVQFNTNCIIYLYVLFLFQHCTIQFNTNCIVLQYSSTHTVSSFLCTVPFPTLHKTVQTNCIMLQYSSTHTVSSLCMNCSFFNTVEYSSTHTVSCYSTVHFKLSHIKVQSIANCIMLQYISTHTVSSLCKYCYFPNTVQYSSTHTLSCYITFQHTL